MFSIVEGADEVDFMEDDSRGTDVVLEDLEQAGAL
jgi:hypothetical protein